MIYLALTLAIGLAALLALIWFERYRRSDTWRQSEFREAAFGFLLWFGGLFGHRVPPPPRPKIEYATSASAEDTGRSLTAADAEGEAKSGP